MSCWWLYAIATDQPIEVHGTLAAAVGGLLPDLDHPESALGRRLRLISVPLSALVGHRGVTHSLLAIVVLLGCLIVVTTQPVYSPLAWSVAPLCVGYLSHLVGDALTPSGVPLLWPNKRRFSLNLFKTWSWQETAFVGVLTMLMLTVGGAAMAMLEELLSATRQQRY